MDWLRRALVTLRVVEDILVLVAQQFGTEAATGGHVHVVFRFRPCLNCIQIWQAVEGTVWLRCHLQRRAQNILLNAVVIAFLDLVMSAMLVVGLGLKDRRCGLVSVCEVICHLS